MTARILVLDDTFEGRHRLQQCLAEVHDLVFVQNILEGLAYVRAEEVDMVICGIYLEHESVFDFLRAIKVDPSLKHVPFICFRASETKMARSIDDGLNMACAALGATKYLVCESTDHIFNLFREVESCLPIDKRTKVEHN